MLDDDIEHIAADVRAYWQMTPDGPVAHMVNLLENQGVGGWSGADLASVLQDQPTPETSSHHRPARAG